MKELRKKMRLIGTLILCLFLVLGVWFGNTVYQQGARWASTSYNQRLSTAGGAIAMGSISDRTGIVVAATDSDGNRRYLSDESARRALSQTIGDQMSMSGTGVETYHAGTLLDLSGSLLDRLIQAYKGEGKKGSDITLTVDARLTNYVASQFPSGKQGAVVVMNYKTGEILSMVSLPTYDPQIIADTRKSDASAADSAYLNRCLQGLYTPGSVFKIVTLISALENLPGIQNEQFTCSGEWLFDNTRVVCASNAVHGDMTLMRAFAKSCNITFAKIAYQLGASKLRSTAESLMFNHNFKIDDIILYNSSFPEAESDDELVWSGVGQGRVLVTPMHMCMITSAIANGGMLAEPRLVKQVTGAGSMVKSEMTTKTTQLISGDMADVVARYMYEVTQTGTGKNAAIDGYYVCGKTGSAETSNDKTVETNAWYTGYIKSDEYPYAVTVVIEKGGAGGHDAAILAQKALTYAMQNVH